jgi:hypothetical protein
MRPLSASDFREVVGESQGKVTVGAQERRPGLRDRDESGADVPLSIENSAADVCQIRIGLMGCYMSMSARREPDRFCTIYTSSVGLDRPISRRSARGRGFRTRRRRPSCTTVRRVRRRGVRRIRPALAPKIHHRIARIVGRLNRRHVASLETFSSSPTPAL